MNSGDVNDTGFGEMSNTNLPPKKERGVTS